MRNHLKNRLLNDLYFSINYLPIFSFIYIESSSLSPMKKFYCLLAFGTLLLLNPAKAQVKAHVGLTSGVNASFVLDKGLSEDPRYNSKMTYKFAPIGLALGLDLSPTFGLNLESIYAQQGQIYEIIGQVNSVAKAVGERKITLDYLQLPLLLNFMGGSTNRTRANFMLGPQLSLLTQGTEIYQQTQTATFTLPAGAELPAGATNYNPQTRAYTLAANTQTIASDKGGNQIEQFKKAQFGLTAALGLNIDITNFLYLSGQIRGNYTLTDMRNEDFIQQVQNGKTSDLFGRRGNLLVGAQLGVHYMFGGTRSNTRMLVK